MFDKDEIIEMARQAGIVFDDKAHPFYERFAKLVAAKEREACAKVCEAREDDSGEWDIQQQCANAIRARGEA